MNKKDKGLNNRQWLCHKTQTKSNLVQSVGAVKYTNCTSAPMSVLI